MSIFQQMGSVVKNFVDTKLDNNATVTLTGDATGSASFNNGSVTVSTTVDTATELGALTDVTVTTPTNGDILTYDGTKWVADAPTAYPGDTVYTNPGTYSWTCPVGVTSVSVVCVGSGGTGGYQWSSGGGGGGGLGYKNNISVTPGQTYTVVVGAPASNMVSNATSTSAQGNNSYFINTSTVCGFGAGRGGTGVTGTNNGGYGGGYTGSGGRGGNGAYQGSWTHGGGGAGGYSGSGADSGNSTGTAGSGGGGGSGGYYSSTYGQPGGGGVGVYGQGVNGAATGNNWEGGKGGSGGQQGGHGEPNSSTSQKGTIYGGYYGGGGGGSGTSTGGGAGGKGAVRIIWGEGRSFPSNAE